MDSVFNFFKVKKSNRQAGNNLRARIVQLELRLEYLEERLKSVGK